MLKLIFVNPPTGNISLDKLLHNSNRNQIHRNRQEQNRQSKIRWEQKLRHRRIQAKSDLPPEINLDRLQTHYLQKPIHKSSHHILSQTLQPKS